ncbi:MAG: hypothetical protein ACPGWR_13490, partial [Ardenticatenaceae bacterium]
AILPFRNPQSAIRNPQFFIMTTFRLIFEVLTYALTLWLGLYLMARNFANLRLRYAGLGAVAYALSLAGDLLVAYVPSGSHVTGATDFSEILVRLHGVLFFLPALFWVRTTIELLPETHPWRNRLREGWLYGLLPVSVLFYLLGAGTDLILQVGAGNRQVGWAYGLFALVVLLPLLGALALVGQIYRGTEATEGANGASKGAKAPTEGRLIGTEGANGATEGAKAPTEGRLIGTEGANGASEGAKAATEGAKARTEGAKGAKGAKKPQGLLLAATLFFGLATGLLLFPLNWLSRSVLVLAIGGDMIGLGLAIALLDAFDEGETLRPDFIRSFESSFFFALLFGGLVAQTMALSTGVSFSMLWLLLLTIALAMITQIFADPIQSALDRFAFASSPKLQEARTELRVEARILPRIDEALDLDTLDQDEWKRLSRRALSHMGNLPRLATNPLARLPLVYSRLAERGVQDDTLERAAELKRLLTESITRLKPPDKGDFGTSKEWRHYNALHFPYVVGLKPYSRRAIHDDLDPVAQQALDWFRTQVPNRTLYNWQNAAAKLVAQDLRERSARVKNGTQMTQITPHATVRN